MYIALFAFPQLTLLDLVGVYDGLRRIAGMGIDAGVRLRIIGTAPVVEDDSGLAIVTQGTYEDLAPFDLLVVPGGMGTRALCRDARCIDYLRSWGVERPVASVCTGALLLGHAGHLLGLRATTHRSALELLRPLCREVVADERVVDEGRVVTAGGVSSSIDLGLHLIARYFGAEARERIRAQMEYRG